MAEYIAAIDLGGTKILTALFNKENEIIARAKTPTETGKGEESLIKDIVFTVNEVIETAGIEIADLKAITMGVPGTVNPHTGLIGVAPNLGIKNFNIKDALSEYFRDIPVFIENDVNIAGLGIKKFEFNDEVKDMLVVFVGTGIGGALFFGGNLYRGAGNFAGEIGHMKVSPSGKFSSNNGKDSFETIASRTAVVESITNDILEGKESTLKKYVETGKRIKSKALANAVAEKDKVVIKHLKASCNTIGTVLGSLTTLLNLDTIVLGGGVIEAMGDYMLPKIESAFNEAVIADAGNCAKLRITKLGDDAPLLGGIALTEELM